MSRNILECFEIYKESIFSLQNDLTFWRFILQDSFKKYGEIADQDIYQAIFRVYNHQHDNNSGLLRCNYIPYCIKISDLEKKRIDFFSWIMNLSILKSYNSLELLILQTIQIKYFPNLCDPIDSKKNSDAIYKEIIKFLESNSIKYDKKNNNHLVLFLSHNSIKLQSFLAIPVNPDSKTSWIDLFALISILRNIIAHCGMIVHDDTLNEIKSKAKDFFENYFDIKDDLNGLSILKPKDDKFDDFITYVNSFAANMCKFVFDKNDLSFLNLT